MCEVTEPTSMPAVGLAVLPHGADLELPDPATRGAAGYDLRAAIDGPLEISPGSLRRVPTGLAMAIPNGYEAQVRPRSGLAARHCIGVLNSPGTIDSDYRGEIQVLLYNFGETPFAIQRGDRIAQLVFARVFRPQLERRELDATERASGGFGHTGK